MSRLDCVSRLILSLISQLDRVGAETWNLNHVAMATTATILVIRACLGQLHGVDWYAFMHALVTGVGSILCLYLDVFAYDSLREGTYTFTHVIHTTHPRFANSRFAHSTISLSPTVRLNPGQCGDTPLTSLHRILPAITMGYSVFDMFDGFHLRLDFLLHGGATFLVMALFVENDVPHLVTSMLLMEVCNGLDERYCILDQKLTIALRAYVLQNSSIFLNLVRSEHLTPFGSMMNQLIFIVTFFFFRIILVPYLWVRDVSKLLEQEQTEDYCLPYYFSKVVLCLGPFFHLLNAYCK